MDLTNGEVAKRISIDRGAKVRTNIVAGPRPTTARNDVVKVIGVLMKRKATWLCWKDAENGMGTGADAALLAEAMCTSAPVSNRDNGTSTPALTSPAHSARRA